HRDAHTPPDRDAHTTPDRDAHTTSHQDADTCVRHDRLDNAARRRHVDAYRAPDNVLSRSTLTWCTLAGDALAHHLVEALLRAILSRWPLRTTVGPGPGSRACRPAGGPNTMC